MDYSNLVFKVDVKELVDADKRVSQLGDAVQHTSNAMDNMAKTSSRNLGRELNNIRENATGSEKAAMKLSDAFGKLGQVGGTVGSIAGSFAELFKWMGSAGQAQKTFTSEAKLANQALGEGNKLFNANNALLAANTLASQKAANAAAHFKDTLAELENIRNPQVGDASADFARMVTLARKEKKAQADSAFWKKQPLGIKQAAGEAWDLEQVKKLEAAEVAAAAEAAAAAANLSRAIGLGIIGLVSIPILAGAAFGAIAHGARDAADKDAELAEKLGITTDRLAVLQLIASENGATVEGLTRTYDKLSRSLNKMDEDNAKTIYSFESLGIALEDVKNQRPEVVAGLIMSNYDKLGQSTKATAAVVQLLGPNFREQSLAIKQAADKLDEYNKRIEQYGGVASKELVEAGGRQEAALSNLGQAWKELKNQLASHTSEMSTGISNWAAGLLKDLADVFNSASNLKRELQKKDILGNISPERRIEIGDKVRAEQAAGITPNTNEAFIKRRLELYQQELQLIDRINAATGGPERISLENQRLLNRSKTVSLTMAETAELERIKRLSAAAKMPEKDGKDKKDTALQDYLRIVKLQMDAEEEWAKVTAEAFSYVDGYAKKNRDAMREMLNFQEDLTASAKQWSETIMKGDFAMIRAQSQSPMDQANAAYKSQQDSIRSQFGGQAADLTRKASEAFDNGEYQQYLQLTEQATKATETMNEKLRESEWVFRKVKVDSEDAWAGMKAGAKSFADSIPTLNVAFASFSQSVLGDFADRLTNLFMTGKFGFEDFVKAAIAQLIKLQMQMAIMKGLQFFGIGGSPAVAPKALGGAYSGGVEFFANGGIFNSPTMFGTAGGLGVMGEAGPEAVMPLRRGRDGKLGVASTNSGNVQVVNNINVSVQGGNTNSDTGNAVAEAVMKRIADQRIYNATRSGGIIRQSLA